MRRVRRFLVPAVSVASFLYCGGGGDSGGTVTPPPPPPAAVATVELSHTTATLVPQQATQVTATTKASNGTTLTGRTVTWQSSASTTASVGIDGTITGVAAGAAIITATSEGKSATVNITVRDGGLIGSSGGTIVANGGKATLTIPPGAVSAPVPITVTAMTNPPSTANVVPGTAYELGPEGTTFAQPVRLEFTYAAPTGSDTAQAFYRISRFTSGKWVPLPVGGGGLPGGRVIAETSSFSQYAVVAFGPFAFGYQGQVTVAPQHGTVFLGQQLGLTMSVVDLEGLPATPRSTNWLSPSAATTTKTGTLTAAVTGVVPGGPYTVNAFAELLLDCRPFKCNVGGYTGPTKPTDWNDPRWILLDEVPYMVSGSTEVVVALIPIATISVTPGPTIPPGQQVTLTANLADAGGGALSTQYRAITWASSNASVATVTQGGEVTAIAPGTTTISASAEGKTGSTTVTVSTPSTLVDHLLVQPSSGGEVELGNTFAVQAWPYDGADKPILGLPVFWSTLDETRGTVTQGGIVTGVGLGQVGIGALVDGVQSGTYLTVVPPYPSAPGTPSAGLAHSCLLRNGGTIWCWGDGTYGARGDGSNSTVQQTPVQVPGSNFAAVSAGGHRTCALNASGTALCWGENTYGQLGDGSQTHKSSPGSVSGGKTFAKIYAARIGGPGGIGTFSCGLEANGAAWCWGWGSFGDGTVPAVHASPTPVVNVPAFSAIALGTSTACGLSLAGEAWCFGTAAVPNTPASGHTFTALTGGDEFFCGLKGNGEAWCWGKNTFGQLGDGSTANRASPVKVNGVSFTQIAAGIATTCGLAQDQTAWCWGIHGGNGDGTPPRGAQGVQAQSTPVPVHGGRQFTEISVGVHTCARAADGTWCWGSIGNFGGELGGPYRYNTPVKVKFP